MDSFSLNNNVKGVQYTNLMKWAINHSDAVMLVYRRTCYKKSDWQKMKSIRAKLSAYRIHTKIDPEKWPGTTFGEPLFPVSHPPVPKHFVDFYAITPEVRRYILNVYHLHGWLAPNQPEDIAFFTKGKCWFYTTIHEHYYTVCGLHPGTREILKSLDIQFDEYQISEDDLYTEPALLPQSPTE